jgi:hypothetical protein
MDLKKRRVQPDNAVNFLVVEVVSASSALAEIAGTAMAFWRCSFGDDLLAMVLWQWPSKMASGRFHGRLPNSDIHRAGRPIRFGVLPNCPCLTAKAADVSKMDQPRNASIV